ncbi:MAG TPA: hypothetical protein VK603_05395 [Candidatus Saccharimonadales bacterium]|nr:hypothetical protein [Candidatus Saccharimonadales bacterium]
MGDTRFLKRFAKVNVPAKLKPKKLTSMLTFTVSMWKIMGTVFIMFCSKGKPRSC